MSRADTGNAHVRSGKRRAPETEISEAQRLLDDPAFIRGMDRVRDGLIRVLEDMKHDGSPEMFAHEQEACRSLRTLKSLRLAIAQGIQGNQLRLAGFKPIDPEES